MSHSIFLKEPRAQVVLRNLPTAKITSEPDHEGWVRVEVEINNGYDALCLYHAGMEARGQQDQEWKEQYRTA